MIIPIIKCTFLYCENISSFIARETKNKTSYFCVHLFMMQSRYICLSQVFADSPADLSWINSSYYIKKKDYILGLAILGGTEAYFKQVPSPKRKKKFFFL